MGVHYKDMLHNVKVHTELLHGIGQDQLCVCTHIFTLVVLWAVCDIRMGRDQDHFSRPWLLAVDSYKCGIKVDVDKSVGMS